VSYGQQQRRGSSSPVGPPSGKIASIVNEMVRSPTMMKRRLREGVEFFQFLRERQLTS